MQREPIIYPSEDSDNARWLGFQHRPGDIVISTRSKSGTTWMQMICALLVFRTTDLPAPLAHLSPWLDWLVTPIEDVRAQLESQSHRRFIKTHTPLNGLPINDMVTYVVVARHPLDAAISLYHQGNNLNRERLEELTGQAPRPGPRPPADEWLRDWIDWEGAAEEELDSMPGFMMHLAEAWERRAEPNIVLVHYDDLLADLDSAMRRLAGRLAIDVAEAVWPELVEAATFERMRARADALAPATAGILKDNAAFFRGGRSGAAAEALREEDLGRYYDRAAELAPPDLLKWLHRGRDVADSARFSQR